ncbi:uncharacterized protein At3g27210-like [Wolffia australiana]
MGACMSVHKDPESVVRFRLGLGPKKYPPVPPEERGGDGGKTKNAAAAPPVWSPNFGSSKDEMFFDSHTWLESDCEDFYSVNGDFTPSRGNTPMATPGRGLPRSVIVASGAAGQGDSNSEPSPRKKLGELFRENGNTVSGEESRRGDQPEEEKEKKGGTLQCCLPGLNVRS